jgi:hypothetical protein
MCYIEFCLSQRKAEFYRAIANALKFFGDQQHFILKLFALHEAKFKFLV